ncbi:MAG: response regulator [Roseibium sp.]|uniref:response regulator n=1 Tax=Roseibium sp. TaxID=1936156 RepID=UPI00262CCC33|nr:response regulator [Roseibium sp.]MCV0427320.1 response regulator [Roseibium sp.]
MIRILVADDSGVARDVITKGINVHRATRYIDIDTVDNGRAALDVLQRKRIDVAFIALKMSGLNGSEVIAELADSKSNNCLVIASDEKLGEECETQLRKHRAYHFLRKPFRQEDVADIVSTYIAMTKGIPVLLVDSSDSARAAIRKILEDSRFDFEIYEASSGEAALRTLSAGKFKVVLTDFQLPGMDGLELAGQVRSLSSRTGVYMMSTSDATFLERSAAFIGISGFLKKPFTADDIDVLMHTFLQLDTPTFGKARAAFSYLDRERKAL